MIKLLEHIGRYFLMLQRTFGKFTKGAVLRKLIVREIDDLIIGSLGIVAFIIKKKSGPIKKIIKNQNNLEVLNQLSLRDGYLAYVLKVGEENFFFIGHKSGRGSLTQINNNSLNNENTKKINIDE